MVLAPNGTVRFGAHNTAVGAFFGYDVDVAQHATVTFEDGFPCAAESCDDGNPCTADACVAGRCVHTPLAEGSFCSDGDECNGLEVCDGAGVCQPGAPLEVDDGIPCTETVCDPVTGAVTLGTSGDPFSLTQLTETTEVNGQRFTTVFDAQLRRFTNSTPLGRKNYVLINSKGRISNYQIDGLLPTVLDYDSRGRVNSVAQSTRVQTFAYDADVPGFLSSMTNALGETTAYGRDAVGRVLQSVLPDGNVVNFAYDAAGQLTSIASPGRPAHGFVYDERGQLIQYAPPVVAGSGMNVTTYVYDFDRKLMDVIRPDGGHVHVGYDAAGRPTNVTLPSGKLGSATRRARASC